MLLFRGSLGFSLRDDADHAAVTLTALEGHDAIGNGIERVVLANLYVGAGIVNSTALTHDDVAGYALLAAPDLNTKSLSC